MKQIYSYTFEPRKRSDRAKQTRIVCSNSDNCEAYKNGSCVLRKIEFMRHSHCPYGQKTSSVGYTQRAKNYRKWINTQKEKFGEDDTKLKKPQDRILKIGEYYYLPYPQIDHDNDLPIKNNFIKEEDLTAEVLERIYRHNPRAILTMEVIRSYRKSTVKKFVKDLHLFYPDLFNLLKTRVPDLKVEEDSLVGRKALLKTLNKDITVKNGKDSWFWDGEYLTSKTKRVLFLDIESQTVEVKVKPKDDVLVEITDLKQVNENTVIVE